MELIIWDDPFGGAFDTPGELEISGTDGVSIAHVVHHAGTHDTYLQDAHRVRHGLSPHGRRHDPRARCLQRQPGSFHHHADGSLAHHGSGGFLDYTVYAFGRVHDPSGLIRGASRLGPGGASSIAAELLAAVNP